MAYKQEGNLSCHTCCEEEFAFCRLIRRASFDLQRVLWTYSYHALQGDPICIYMKEDTYNSVFEKERSLD